MPMTVHRQCNGQQADGYRCAVSPDTQVSFIRERINLCSLPHRSFHRWRSSRRIDCADACLMGIASGITLTNAKDSPAINRYLSRGARVYAP
jgi:hypothetical protein